MTSSTPNPTDDSTSTDIAPEFTSDASQFSDSPTDKPKKRGLARLGGCVIAWVPTILLAALVYVGLTTFVVQTVEVQQTSMFPTLKPGDRLVVERLDRNFHYGDIVIFVPPASTSAAEGTDYIKRVIGLPGDLIEIHDNAVWRNGTKISEPYLASGVITTTSSGNPASWTIAPGQMFVMGDNRPGSSDSRVFGPIDISSVAGKVIIRYWPLPKFGMP